MSRTYRRKAIKNAYYNFKSKEDFEVSKHHFDLGAQRPEHHRPYPQRPVVATRTGWLNRVEMVTLDHRHYGYPEYKKWQRKTQKWYNEYRNLDEYANWVAADEYRRYGNGAKTYEEFKARADARHHSDNGYEVHGRTTPRWFRRVFGLAPLRTETRSLIRKGQNGGADWEDIVFTDKQANVGWFYW